MKYFVLAIINYFLSIGFAWLMLNAVIEDRAWLGLVFVVMATVFFNLAEVCRRKWEKTRGVK